MDLKDFVKMPFLSAIVGLGLVAHGEAGFLPRFPQDPSYVQLSAHCSFYVLSVDSTEWHRFGLAAAPVIEPSRFNQGEGIDVLAVPSVYSIMTEVGTFKGTLDGKNSSGPLRIEAGHHEIERAAGSGRLALFWARAAEKGYDPFSPLAPEPWTAQD